MEKLLELENNIASDGFFGVTRILCQISPPCLGVIVVHTYCNGTRVLYSTTTSSTSTLLMGVVCGSVILEISLSGCRRAKQQATSNKQQATRDMMIIQ